MKTLPILKSEEVRALIRRAPIKQHVCMANRAHYAAEAVSKLAGLNFQQHHLIVNFIADVAAFAEGCGFSHGIKGVRYKKSGKRFVTVREKGGGE